MPPLPEQCQSSGVTPMVDGSIDSSHALANLIWYGLADSVHRMEVMCCQLQLHRCMCHSSQTSQPQQDSSSYLRHSRPCWRLRHPSTSMSFVGGPQTLPESRRGWKRAERLQVELRHPWQGKRAMGRGAQNCKQPFDPSAREQTSEHLMLHTTPRFIRCVDVNALAIDSPIPLPTSPVTLTIVRRLSSECVSRLLLHARASVLLCPSFVPGAPLSFDGTDQRRRREQGPRMLPSLL